MNDFRENFRFAWNAVLATACVAFFLLVLAFGNPPQALGLDPAWTEVLAWGFLHNVQWGRDLVFSYGPLGFLHPFSAYFSGIFPWFVGGEIALSAAFVLTIGLMFYRTSLPLLGLFALVYILCFWKLAGDLSWEFTLIFGSTALANLCRKAGVASFVSVATFLACAFAAIALTKFSTFPLWVVCVSAVVAVCALERRNARAMLVACIFPSGLILAWLACGQQLENLPRYLQLSLEVASGYSHAMGLRAPFAADLAGVAVVCIFVIACMHTALRSTTSRAAVPVLAMNAAATVLLWLASFIRGDDYHWPTFFAAMSLLPFSVLCNRYLSLTPVRRPALLVVIGCIVIGCFPASPWSTPQLALTRLRGNVQTLGHLPELREQREAEWQSLVAATKLSRVRERVGNRPIDMVTWQQGMVLLNDLNYAPRPVFQSYVAYTPKLARLNEAYFLGATAPDFVLFSLDYSDARLPSSEDGLALLALVKRYRPALVDKGFLLLERDAGTSAASVIANDRGKLAALGDEIPLIAEARPAIGFIGVNLNPFGKIYSLLFREPALFITVKTTDGQQTRHRLIRATAASGFLITPVMQSTQDWIKLYLARPLPKTQSIQVDSEFPWERYFFEHEITFASQAVEVLHADALHSSAALGNLLYPEFNVPPSNPTDPRIIDEDGEESAFVHAPGSIGFKPAPGNYSVSATYGVQSAALSDSACLKAHPDGVGVSLVLKSADTELVLLHMELDPFQTSADRGPQHLRIVSVDIDSGDEFEYRVDPGHGGNNVSCDWTYVRDFIFNRRGAVGWERNHPGLLFADGFD